MSEPGSAEELSIIFKGEKQKISHIAKTTGYPNSGVFCRNIDELIGVMTHGLDNEITPTNALKIAEEMEKMGILKTITFDGKFFGWQIHSNEDAEIPQPLFDTDSKSKKKAKKKIK